MLWHQTASIDKNKKKGFSSIKIEVMSEDWKCELIYFLDKNFISTSSLLKVTFLKFHFKYNFYIFPEIKSKQSWNFKQFMYLYLYVWVHVILQLHDINKNFNLLLSVIKKNNLLSSYKLSLCWSVLKCPIFFFWFVEECLVQYKVEWIIFFKFLQIKFKLVYEVFMTVEEK